MTSSLDTHLWSFKRDLLIKTEEESDPNYGHQPLSRPIGEYLRYGVINLDKPCGPTSHEVVAWVKRLLHINHAGHSGTLDPKVTGVLPIALEEATKVIGVLLLSPKEYVCVMRLHGSAPEKLIRETLNEFVGEIIQRPPLRSSVQRAIRTRKIYYIRDIEFKDNRILFRVACQAGTYIRKLCHDVGEALGVGAHMEELRRTRSGPFSEDEKLVSLYDLQDAYVAFTEGNDESKLRAFVQPVENAVHHLPRVYVRDSAVDAICHGARLAIPGISKLDSDITPKRIVGIFSLKGELVAVGRAVISSDDIMVNEHGIAVETLRVVMPPGTYPKMWRKHQ
jgi:H/ACA ribonucleoprotein complex subunit 4